MLLIIGFLIVFGATMGGFMLAGGHPAVLLHVSEFVVIGGVALGILVVASPFSTLKLTLTKIIGAFKGGGSKEENVDLLKLLFELFNVGRKGGVIALEEHLSSPKSSSIFSKYPSFINDHHRVDFLCNSLRPIVDGRVRPDQLDEVLEHDLDAKQEAADGPIHVLQLIGDSLPGVGIVAAVLGIINTMAAIAEGPEAVGEKVAAALTGTFLGILAAYGFVNPLTSRIKANNEMEHQYLKSIKKGVIAFATGMAPIMAVEISRRCLDHTVQPAADELEETLKTSTRRPPDMAKKDGGHHGGAWKVAYADFVTALMALFMVLWISGQNVEIRKATSKFFQDPYNALPERSSGMMSAQVAGARNDESHTDPTAPANMGFLQAIAKELYRLVNVEEKQDEKPIDIQITSDGLRINLYNRAGKPLFLKDSSEFTEWGNFVVQTVAWLIDRYDFKVFIDGHVPTGREPLRKDYGSWELSADRANASRRALQHYAVDPKLIERVSGFGDTAPLPNTAPGSDSNERITISLSAQQQSLKRTAAAKAYQAKKAESVTTP